MAKIEANVKVPAVPEFLETEVPGRARAMRLPLGVFSDEELEQVAEDYKAALLAKASEQRSMGTVQVVKSARKARQPAPPSE